MAKNLNKAILLVILMILAPISGMNLTSSELSPEDSSMKSSAIVGNGIDNPIEIDSTEQLALYYSKEDAGSGWGAETDEIWFTADKQLISQTSQRPYIGPHLTGYISYPDP